MSRMHIDTVAAAHDLLALASEIQDAEHLTGAESLRRAQAQLTDPFLPPTGGEPIEVWTSIAIGPLLWDGSSPLLAVRHDEVSE